MKIKPIAENMKWIGVNILMILNCISTIDVNQERCLVLLNETFIRFHLQINVSKTKTIIVNYKCISRDEEMYPESITSLNGKAVENVKIFRYFGDDIKFNEPSTGTAKIRTSVAESKFIQLSRKLCNRNTNLVT